jgi:hypothetical protein
VEESLDFGARLSAVETDVAELKADFLNTKDKLMNSNATTQQMVSEVNSQLSDIRAFITGTNQVFGFAKKHWMKALSFGCGLMTAAGVGNPNVIHFIQHFFNL